MISHCSGWLSESQALDRLGIPHAVRMASDINPRVRDFIVKNHTINYWTDPLEPLPASPHLLSAMPAVRHMVATAARRRWILSCRLLSL